MSVIEFIVHVDHFREYPLLDHSIHHERIIPGKAIVFLLISRPCEISSASSAYFFCWHSPAPHRVSHPVGDRPSPTRIGPTMAATPAECATRRCHKSSLRTCRSSKLPGSFTPVTCQMESMANRGLALRLHPSLLTGCCSSPLASIESSRSILKRENCCGPMTQRSIRPGTTATHS